MFTGTSELYSWRYKRTFSLHIQKPESLEDVLRKCDFNNLWSRRGQSYSFILPEYLVIYAEEWDWTNTIWYQDKENVEPLLETAKKVGLYILE